METPISFEHVSKQYRIGAGRESLREAISRAGGRIINGSYEARQDRMRWALRDITVQVEAGEALGIIGVNGAGKTTMLKLLSKVTRPTAGRIYSKGRIASLIELGAGFHPDLTGRENIYLNGAILGLSQRDIRRRFDSIVAFAELEKSIDMPVKRYSSGMYARLGFAVAAHVEPEILLVDEVLAVGDEAFQLKCHEFIHSFVKGGATSLFVSHNLYAIEQLCDRVIWLDRGEIAKLGTPTEVLKAYLDETDRHLAQMRDTSSTLAEDHLRICSLRVIDSEGKDRDGFQTGEDILIAVEYESHSRLVRPYFCVWISEAQSRMPLFSANMLLDDFPLAQIDRRGVIICEFKAVPLMPKAYNVWVEVYGNDRAQILYKWRILGGFCILDSEAGSNDVQRSRGRVRFTRQHGPIRVPYEWRLQEGANKLHTPAKVAGPPTHNERAIERRTK